MGGWERSTELFCCKLKQEVVIKWARLRANQNVSEVYGRKDYDPVNFEVICARFECSCFTTAKNWPESRSGRSTHIGH